MSRGLVVGFPIVYRFGSLIIIIQLVQIFSLEGASQDFMPNLLGFLPGNGFIVGS